MIETVRSHLLFQICSNRSSDSLNRFCRERERERDSFSIGGEGECSAWVSKFFVGCKFCV